MKCNYYSLGLASPTSEVLLRFCRRHHCNLGGEDVGSLPALQPLPVPQVATLQVADP